MLPELFLPGGSTTRSGKRVRPGFCLLLPPTKFCKKPEKLKLNLIGMCQMPCFTEEYMRNSIKRNEYVFLEDLESFLFLMEVCISYPIIYKHRF